MWWKGQEGPTTNTARNSDVQQFWASSKGHSTAAIKNLTGRLRQRVLTQSCNCEGFLHRSAVALLLLTARETWGSMNASQGQACTQASKPLPVVVAEHVMVFKAASCRRPCQHTPAHLGTVQHTSAQLSTAAAENLCLSTTPCMRAQHPMPPPTLLPPLAPAWYPPVLQAVTLPAQ